MSSKLQEKLKICVISLLSLKTIANNSALHLQMPQIKVDTVVCINGNILIVYYTPGQCWQFRVISRTGGVFGEQKLYYTARAALKMGLSWFSDEV